MLSEFRKISYNGKSNQDSVVSGWALKRHNENVAILIKYTP